jgi:hypothetical protein
VTHKERPSGQTKSAMAIMFYLQILWGRLQGLKMLIKVEYFTCQTIFYFKKRGKNAILAAY